MLRVELRRGRRFAPDFFRVAGAMRFRRRPSAAPLQFGVSYSYVLRTGPGCDGLTPANRGELHGARHVRGCGSSLLGRDDFSLRAVG